MRIFVLGFIIIVVAALALLDGFLAGSGYSTATRKRVALGLVFVSAIFAILAGWNGWFTGWGVDAELRQ